MKRKTLLVITLVALVVGVSLGMYTGIQPTPDTTGGIVGQVLGAIHDPVKLIAVVFNVVMGIVSVPITNLAKKFVPFLVARGWVVPIASTVVGFAFVLLGNWIFGLSVFDHPDLWKTLVTALGINVTAAQMFFEYRKGKTS